MRNFIPNFDDFFCPGLGMKLFYVFQPILNGEPQVFDGIKVGGEGRPLENIDTMVAEEILR